MKDTTTQSIMLILIIGLSFIAGGLVVDSFDEDNTVNTPVIKNNVIQETEVHYYPDDSTLSMTAIYHEDGSIDTHTEYSYPIDYLDQEEIPLDFDSEELPLDI